MTIFWVRSTTGIILVLAKKIALPVKKKLFTILWYLWLQKMVGKNKFFPALFWYCCWIRNPRSGIRMDKNKDPGSGVNIPDPQHCLKHVPKIILYPWKGTLVAVIGRY
jgi:hypothetical protein